MGDHRKLGTYKTPARGVQNGSYRQLLVKIDPETFEQIRDRAVDEKTSMAHQIRLVIEWGLMA